MKNKIILFKSIALLLCLLSTIPMAANAADSDNLIISATVNADCTLSLDKSTVNLGNFDTAVIERTSKDSKLGFSRQFTATATCTGTTHANLLLSTAGSVADGYLVPTGDVIRYGIDLAANSENLPFSDTTKKASTYLSGSDLSTGEAVKFDVYAVAGSSTEATTGTYSSSITLALTPM